MRSREVFVNFKLREVNKRVSMLLGSRVIVMSKFSVLGFFLFLFFDLVYLRYYFSV